MRNEMSKEIQTKFDENVLVRVEGDLRSKQNEPKRQTTRENGKIDRVQKAKSFGPQEI